MASLLAALDDSSVSRRVGLIVLVWLAMLGADFVLNGAVFARIYQQSDPFLLSPTDAFRRIPLGYLAFLLVAAGLVEVAQRLNANGLVAGVKLGLVAGAGGALIWGLSLFSITSVSIEVGVAFAIIWFVLLLVGSAVAGYGLARRSLWRTALAVIGFDVLCVAGVVALQSLGVVPATRV